MSTCIEYVIATPAKPVDNEPLCKIENRVIKKTIEDPMISIRIHNHLKIDSNIFQECMLESI